MNFVIPSPISIPPGGTEKKRRINQKSPFNREKKHINFKILWIKSWISLFGEVKFSYLNTYISKNMLQEKNQSKQNEFSISINLFLVENIL